MIMSEDNIVWGYDKNRMEGKFRIYGVGDSTLDSEITSRAYREEDLKVALISRAYMEKDLKVTINIKYRNDSDLNGNLLANMGDYLDSYFTIRPHNQMYGVVEILEPPRIEDKLLPIKDSTTRTSLEYKYLNYGNSSSMMIGNNSDTGENFHSFLQFETNKYPSTVVIEKAKLKIYYVGRLYNKEGIELYQIDREWKEDSVTEANRPLKTELISDTYTINEEDSYIEFDVFDYVLNILDENTENFGLMIRSDGLQDSFYTKESHRPPELNVTYFDTRVFSVGNSTLNGTLLSIARGNVDLDATFRLKTDWSKSELDATLFLHKPDTIMTKDLDSILRIITPDLNSRFRVARNEYNDLNGHLRAQIHRNNELNAVLYINTPELSSNLEIKYRDDLESVLTSRAVLENSIKSVFYTNTPDLNATLFAKYSDDFSGILYIRRNEGSQLESTLSISKPDLNSVLTSRAIGNNSIDCILTIQQHDTSSMDGIVHVSKPELYGIITAKISDDILATLQITKPDLFSSLTIRGYAEYDFNAMFTPRIIKASDLNCNVNIINKYRSSAYYYIL